MDFVTKLLQSRDTVIGTKYDSILTIVDQLTKWAYFIQRVKEGTRVFYLTILKVIEAIL